MHRRPSDYAQHKELEAFEEGMVTLSTYFKKWKLNLRTAKTVSDPIHSSNNEANCKLNVIAKDQKISSRAEPTYLGVKLDRTLMFRSYLNVTALKIKIT